MQQQPVQERQERQERQEKKQEIMDLELKNKGFSIFHDICYAHGWHLVVNEMTHLCYTKAGDETTTIDIQIGRDKIAVTVPLKDSAYQYRTTFGNYSDASDYIEQRFFDYVAPRLSP